MHSCPAAAIAAMALSLSAALTHELVAKPAADLSAGSSRTSIAPKTSRPTSTRAPRLAPIGPSALDLSAERPEQGNPLLTISALDKLRKGDTVTLARPDGQWMQMQLHERAFSGPGMRQWYFEGEATGLLYAVIVASGPHLAGYFHAMDGELFNMTPAPRGGRLIPLAAMPAGMECGVGRLDPKHAPAAAAAADGGLDGSALCPPVVTPFGTPAGLDRDGGSVIDIMVVWSVDAVAHLSDVGREYETESLLAVTLINRAMTNSAVQSIEQFNGRDQNNQQINQCGYGADDGDPTTPPLNVADPDAGLGLPPVCDLGPTSCGDNAESKSAHLSLALGAPAESDVYLPRVHLAAVLVLDGFFGQEEPYDSTGWQLDLGRLSDPIDGYMDYIHGWRDALGADAVMMVGKGYQDEGAGFAGLAYVMRDAITLAQSGVAPAGPNADPALDLAANPFPILDSVSGAGGANEGEVTLMQFGDVAATAGVGPYFLIDVLSVASLVPAHELGHNLGCHHDHDNAGEAQGALFPDSFGYPPTGEQGGGGYRTIMAYDGGAQRLPGFSNPDRTWADYSGPEGATEAAGLAFDFDCDLIDQTDTDAMWTPETGTPCGPDPCDSEDDSMFSGNSPAITSPDAGLEDDGKTTANNARSISQSKYPFARFRCSLRDPQDCNNNLIDDFIESVDGFVTDCDQNGVPDSCDTVVVDPDVPNQNDCNGNGFPDNCDISTGESPDENSNGMPDECEDNSLLFREGFELRPLGFSQGAMFIAPIDADFVTILGDGTAQVDYVDPEDGTDVTFEAFVDPTDDEVYFAKIETVGAGAGGEGNYIYTDMAPSAGLYPLGMNGAWGMTAMQGGIALAFGNRGYGQMLNFNPQTGTFASELGVTTITLATEAEEGRLWLNAVDFTGYFGEDSSGGVNCADPLLPSPDLVNFGLCQNAVTIEAFDDADDDPATTNDWTLVYQIAESLNGTRTPGDGSIINNPDAMVQRHIVAGPALPDPLKFDRIRITGAFVVIDNLAFDLGVAWSDCEADMAGGPLTPEGLPTPDGDVDANDLVAVLGTFGVDPGTDPLAALTDINTDGTVDALDLIEVMLNWGPCPGGQ